jgi:ubiquinone/menaquinone biosynthesis C-methylase UbiE
MSFTSIYKYTRYIDDTRINTNQFNKFMTNFVKLHNHTKFLSDNFSKYIKILEEVYDFILLNLIHIKIRVDGYDNYMEKYCSKISDALGLKSNICEIKNNQILPPDSYRIIDFGGGQGIFLNYMCGKLNTKLCSVIEKKHDEFVYSQKIIESNKNINYTYWDNIKFDIQDNVIDCCCAIQVLHHLTDELIDIVIGEFYRILKPNSIVFLVEHDAVDNIRINIDSDHHLYYILNDQIRMIRDKKLISVSDCVNDFKKYTKNQYINYKTEAEWTELFVKHKFKVDTLSLNKIPYNGKYYSIYRK